MKSLIGHVATYKSSLSGCFQLASEDVYNQGTDVPFDSAEATYMRNVVGRPVPSNIPEEYRASFNPYTSDNYRTYFSGALFTKAGIANDLYKIMALDPAYTKNDKRAVLKVDSTL